MLGRHVSSLLSGAGSALASRGASPVSHTLVRSTSTKTTARPAKAKAAGKADAAIVSKKISTKSPSSSAAKPGRPPKVAVKSAAGNEALVSAKAATSVAAAAKKKAERSANATSAKPSPAGPNRDAISQNTKLGTPTPPPPPPIAPASASGAARHRAVSSGLPDSPALPAAQQRQLRQDLSQTPEYKRASRRVTSIMVALPILLVTSYFLLDRFAYGNVPKSLEAFRLPVARREQAETPPTA